jgi:hypothetical protein
VLPHLDLEGSDDTSAPAAPVPARLQVLAAAAPAPSGADGADGADGGADAALASAEFAD